MAWDIEFSDACEAWWDDLSEEEKISVGHVIDLLEVEGPALPFPYSSRIEMSRHGGMRELRIQHKGQPYRVLYAFDPTRTAPDPRRE